MKTPYLLSSGKARQLVAGSSHPFAAKSQDVPRKQKWVFLSSLDHAD